MATRKELDKLRDARWEAMKDRQFALSHGYDDLVRKKTAEINDLNEKIKKGMGLN